jgi:hypothetical protein
MSEMEQAKRTTGIQERWVSPKKIAQYLKDGWKIADTMTGNGSLMHMWRPANYAAKRAGEAAKS